MPKKGFKPENARRKSKYEVGNNNTLIEWVQSNQNKKTLLPQQQAQMCAEGCEGVFLYSLISIREKVFSI